MYIAPHGILGSLICKTVDRVIDKFVRDRRVVKVIAFWFVTLPLAFFSHFLLDKIPHYDYSITSPNFGIGCIKLAIDFLVWFILLDNLNKDKKYIAGPDGEKMILAGSVALLPDIVVNLSKLFHLTYFAGFVAFHDRMHTPIHPGFVIGMITQVGIVLFCCWGFKLLNKMKG